MTIEEQKKQERLSWVLREWDCCGLQQAINEAGEEESLRKELLTVGVDIHKEYCTKCHSSPCNWTHPPDSCPRKCWDSYCGIRYQD